VLHRKIPIEVADLMLIFTPSVSMTSEANDLKGIMQDLRNNLVDISHGSLEFSAAASIHGAE
jgi:hypothetical protein